MKVKQTVSIEQEVVKEAKHRAIDKGESLSEYIESAIKEKNRREQS